MPEVIQKWFFQSDLCLGSVPVSASLFPLPETLALLKPQYCSPTHPESTVFTHPSSSIKTTLSKICQLIGISYIAFAYLLWRTLGKIPIWSWRRFDPTAMIPVLWEVDGINRLWLLSLVLRQSTRSVYHLLDVTAFLQKRGAMVQIDLLSKVPLYLGIVVAYF